jgi:nucleotide-binding universal stress UspA family protein
MIRNILVGYDGSRSGMVAVEQAMGVADATDGRLHLATVVEASDSAAEDELLGGELDPVQAAMPPDEEEPEEPLAAPPDIEEMKAACEDRHIVCEQATVFSEGAGASLVRRSWLADLVVVDRSSAPGQAGAAELGPTARHLVNRLVSPTLVCARQYLHIRSALIVYQASVSSGRALSFAAELCEEMNASLDVLACDPDRRVAAAALEEARPALRGYHVEGEHSVSVNPPAEAMRNAAMEREVSVIIVPDARRHSWGLPWGRNEVLWRALEIPNTAVLAYP